MNQAIRSEFKKLLTIRSTYFITAFVILLTGFLSSFVFGYHQAALPVESPNYLSDVLYSMLSTFATFLPIVAILMVTHEYRYNLISYTLTFNRSRLKVLVAKVFTILSYATVVGAIVVAISYIGSKIGTNLADASLVEQELPALELLWRYTVYLWGWALVGLIIAVFVRSIVGAIVAIFVIPTIEGLSTLLLNENSKFLPFTSLEAVAATPTDAIPTLPPAQALGILAIYLSAAGILAAIAFVRRDVS